MNAATLATIDTAADTVGAVHSLLEELDPAGLDLHTAAQIARAAALLDQADEVLTLLYIDRAPAVAEEGGGG